MWTVVAGSAVAKEHWRKKMYEKIEWQYIEQETDVVFRKAGNWTSNKSDEKECRTHRDLWILLITKLDLIQLYLTKWFFEWLNSWKIK